MKIAISADPFFPIPPENYGGIERMISFLAEGLLARGHEVLLAAHSDSKVKAPLLCYPRTVGKPWDFVRNMITVNRLYSWRPDVIHSFSRLAYLAPLLTRKVPKIMSYQREPTLSQIRRAVSMSKRGSLNFTGCSDYISSKIRPFGNSRTVYNGVEMEKYDFKASVVPDAPLIFLGRIEPIKGTHHAVHTALASGRKLIIAGNIPNEHKNYFEHAIKPHLSRQIEYVGEVNDYQKNILLGGAAALLMPVEWDEPFGIVMCEAMACGTPVIGFSRGAVPEVVREGISGFVCMDLNGMVAAVSQVIKIDRADVHSYCAGHFSSEVIVEDYLQLYNSLI